MMERDIRIQDLMEKYYNNIRLGKREKAFLRKKREMLIGELRKVEGIPKFKIINQGSYGMNTGIKPTNGRDYDIDIGIDFDISTSMVGPIEAKAWVEKSLKRQHNRTVKRKDVCLQVQYHSKGEPDYHVDFAVYGKDEEGNLQVARGRPMSTSDDRKLWEDSRPRELKRLIRNKYDNREKKKQFQRTVAFFKRWKDTNFENKGYQSPTGIALTVNAMKYFEPVLYTEFNGRVVPNDLNAFSDLINRMCADEVGDHGLNVNLPVEPYNDLLEKMKRSGTNRNRYINKVKDLQHQLCEARCTNSPQHAVEHLQNIFGTDFPTLTDYDEQYNEVEDYEEEYEEESTSSTGKWVLAGLASFLFFAIFKK